MLDKLSMLGFTFQEILSLKKVYFLMSLFIDWRNILNFLKTNNYLLLKPQFNYSEFKLIKYHLI